MKKSYVMNDYISYINENEEVINKIKDGYLSTLISPLLDLLDHILQKAGTDDLVVGEEHIFSSGFEALGNLVDNCKLFKNHIDTNKAYIVELIIKLEEYVEGAEELLDGTEQILLDELESYLDKVEDLPETIIVRTYNYLNNPNYTSFNDFIDQYFEMEE